MARITRRERRKQHVLDNDRYVVHRHRRVLLFAKSLLVLWYIAAAIGVVLSLSGNLDSTINGYGYKATETKSPYNATDNAITENKKTNEVPFQIMVGLSTFLLVFVFGFALQKRITDTVFERKDVSLISYVLTASIVLFGIAQLIYREAIVGAAIVVFAFVMFLVFVGIDKYLDYIGEMKTYVEDQKEYAEEQKEYFKRLKGLQEHYTEQVNIVLKKIPGLKPLSTDELSKEEKQIEEVKKGGRNFFKFRNK